MDDEDYEALNKLKWFFHEEDNGTGYAVRHDTSTGKEKWLTMHVAILNTPKGMHSDHIDGNKLNNCRNNLRICTQSQNACNRPKNNDKQYSSRYKGVHYHKNSGRWHAQIEYKGIKHHVGMFASQELAHTAYVEKAKVLHGEFAHP